MFKLLVLLFIIKLYARNNIFKNKITYKESPFKSIIADIRNKLSKIGNKLIEKALYYVEEMKKVTESQVKSIKEKLIKFKYEPIKKNKINNIKKDLDDYNRIKDIRYLFNEEDIKSIIEDIKRGLYYVEKMSNLSTSDFRNIK